MADERTPVAIADDNLDAVQGAGTKLQRTSSKIVMHEEQETVLYDPKRPSKRIVLSSESEDPAFKKG